jgi:hypothetical protein
MTAWDYCLPADTGGFGTNRAALPSRPPYDRHPTEFRLGRSPQAKCRERMNTPSSVRSRLRFDRLDHEVTPDGSGMVSVTLEWGRQTYAGSVPCLETLQGVIKAASQATLTATLASTQSGASGGMQREVVGVKAVRAFDGWVVVTRINGTSGDERLRLLGAAPCEAEEDLPGAAVKAVLNASNRVMEQQIAREGSGNGHGVPT